MLAVKILAVFIMSVAFGVLYRIPRGLLLYGGMIGLVTWLTMYLARETWGNIILASFFGSLITGFCSELLARGLKKPATIFIIPGFIPLVPGGEAYKTMVFMVAGHYSEGVAMGMQTILTGGAIAFGLFLSSMIYRIVINNAIGERRSGNVE